MEGVAPRIRWWLALVTALAAAACAEPVASLTHPLAAPDAAPDQSAGCGTLGAVGCCQGQTLRFCAAGQPKAQACPATAKCGWNVKYGLYGCGPTAGADPSGKHPRACAGQSSDAAVDAPAPPPDLALADQSSPDLGGCGPVGFAGCCAKQKLLFCVAGKLKTLECGAKLYCGWDPKGSYYACGTAGAADPSGKHPQSCSKLIGDAGINLDGGADLPGDQGPGDLPAEAAADAATDAGADGDAAPVNDLPGGDQPGDAPAGERLVGLDAVGLEPSLVEPAPPDSGEGGCGSCAVATPWGAAPGPLWFALALCLVALRRRGS